MSSREQTGAPIPWNEFRPTVGSTIAVILGVALLLGLGSWQMVRLDWKTGLIAERTAQLEAQPILLPTDAGDLLDVMWSPVKLTGRFLHDQEIFLSARSQRGNLGTHARTQTHHRRHDDGDDPRDGSRLIRDRAPRPARGMCVQWA